MLLIFQSLSADVNASFDGNLRDSGRVLIGTPVDLTVALYYDEIPAEFDSVTVTVTSLDGTVIVTDDPAASLPNGAWKWMLPAHDRVDVLTLAWTATVGGQSVTLTTRAEVVGGFYTSLADIRAADPSLASVSTWPTAKLDVARAEAEDEAERIMGRCFTRRYAVDRRLRVDDAGNIRTAWPHINTIRKIVATLYGDALTTSAAACKIVGDSTVWIPGLPAGSLVELHYEHGLDGDFAAGVVGAVRIRARQFVQGSNSRVPLYSERVTIDANGSTVARMLPKANSTGVAEVDAVYSAHSLNFGIS